MASILKLYLLLKLTHVWGLAALPIRVSKRSQHPRSELLKLLGGQLRAKALLSDVGEQEVQVSWALSGVVLEGVAQLAELTSPLQVVSQEVADVGSGEMHTIPRGVAEQDRRGLRNGKVSGLGLMDLARHLRQNGGPRTGCQEFRDVGVPEVEVAMKALSDEVNNLSSIP